MHLFKTHSEHVIHKEMPLVNKILSLDETMQKMSNEELRAQTDKFKALIKDGTSLDKILPEAFATVREATKRTLSIKQYPVQLLSGIMLYRGCVSEQKTGEGKTLVCAAPAYLTALTGMPVHVVTVNDYLANRDANEIGQIHRFLGLTVGCVLSEMPNSMRQQAYACDITYVTNNELGFDYLRDNMAMSKEETVLRGLGYAIIDEADSVLIDEARTPLIISGHGEQASQMYDVCTTLAKMLKRGTSTEFSMSKLMDGEEFTETGDYAVNEKEKNIVLTGEGIKKVEKFFNINDLSSPDCYGIHHHVMLALRAKELMHRDKDYVVQDGEVRIVDEFTGRVMPGRRYSDGLHQAIEAKENVNVNSENHTYATITFQSFFNKYEKKAGMTGTAMTEKNEFRDIYGMDVIAIPTNRPVIRVDHEDSVYKTLDEKYRAVVLKVKEIHEKGQPVLVGTTDIKTSEIISNLLKKEGLPHNVLNAKNNELEAEIISHAGQYGAITLATNMAGRGTDIKLDERARAAGGLYVIGTQRHESRRIDNQLIGRSGRQGDPGESKFYLSLEDKLMTTYMQKNFLSLLKELDTETGEEIESHILSKAVTKAQKAVESANFAAREQLMKYDTVNQQQCAEIYAIRNKLLTTDHADEALSFFADTYIHDLIDDLYGEGTDEEISSVMTAIRSTIGTAPTDFEKTGNIKRDKDTLYEKSCLIVKNKLDAVKQQEQWESLLSDCTKTAAVRAITFYWAKHLEDMERLREGIGLMAYAQTDAVVEYQKQGNELFYQMTKRIKEDVLRKVLCGPLTAP